MWIILIIFAAFFNSLWTALSKFNLQKISPYRFTLAFRALTALFLLPFFLYDFNIPANPKFWLAIISAGAFEISSIYAQSLGVRKDFYSTFSLANTSPLFTILIAPYLLPESVNLLLFLGVIFTISGGFIFYNLKHKFCIYGILRAFFMSMAAILSKVALGYSSGFTVPFIMFIVGVFFITLSSMFVKESLKWSQFKPFIKNLAPLALISAIATLCFYSAAQITPITRASPLMRLNLIFGFFLSYFMLKEKEHFMRKLLAGLLILIGAVLISLSLT